MMRRHSGQVGGGTGSLRHHPIEGPSRTKPGVLHLLWKSKIGAAQFDSARSKAPVEPPPVRPYVFTPRLSHLAGNAERLQTAQSEGALADPPDTGKHLHKHYSCRLGCPARSDRQEPPPLISPSTPAAGGSMWSKALCICNMTTTCGCNSTHGCSERGQQKYRLKVTLTQNAGASTGILSRPQMLDNFYFCVTILL